MQTLSAKESQPNYDSRWFIRAVKLNYRLDILPVLHCEVCIDCTVYINPMVKLNCQFIGCLKAIASGYNKGVTNTFCILSLNNYCGLITCNLELDVRNYKSFNQIIMASKNYY